MEWYKNMTKDEQNNFKKVIVVSIVGAITICIVPMCFRIVF